MAAKDSAEKNRLEKQIRLSGHPGTGATSGAGFLLPAFQDACNNRVEILLKPGFALSGVIPATMGITLDKPYRIARPEILHQHFEPPDPDLIERLYFHRLSPP